MRTWKARRGADVRTWEKAGLYMPGREATGENSLPRGFHLDLGLPASSTMAGKGL